MAIRNFGDVERKRTWYEFPEIGERQVGRSKHVSFEIDTGVCPNLLTEFDVINMGGNLGSGGFDRKRNNVQMFLQHQDRAVQLLEQTFDRYQFELTLIAPECHSDELQEYHRITLADHIKESAAKVFLVLHGTNTLIETLKFLAGFEGFVESIKAKGQRVCLAGSSYAISMEGEPQITLGVACAHLELASPGSLFMVADCRRFDHGKVSRSEDGGFVTVP